MQRNTGVSMTPDAPPTCVFGVLPVQSNAALAPKPTFANVIVQWQIETALETVHNIDSIYPNVNLPIIQAYDPQYSSVSLGDADLNSDVNCVYISGRRKYNPNSAFNNRITSKTDWKIKGTKFLKSTKDIVLPPKK